MPIFLHMPHDSQILPQPEQLAHKLQVCTMAASTGNFVLDLTWATCLNFSFKCPTKTAWPRKWGISSKYYKIIYILCRKLSEDHKAAWGREQHREKCFYYIRETVGWGPRLKGEKPEFSQTGFQRILSYWAYLFIINTLPNSKKRQLVIKHKDTWTVEKKRSETKQRRREEVNTIDNMSGFQVHEILYYNSTL